MASSPPDKPIRITAVVPVLNAMRFLPTTVPSVLKAAERATGIEIIYVDNGSTDGSFEYLTSLTTDRVRVEQRAGASISAQRNLGAQLGTGVVLSFLDADCAVGTDYFNEALAVLSSTGASATGCEIDIPPETHWVDGTWHALHYLGRGRDVRYINSGNFVVRRSDFETVGGFREDLLTGEDAELGHRLTRGGYRIVSAPSVAAIHYGGPDSIRSFYRRNVWHGLGMFGTVRRGEIDRPTAMMGLHFLATIIGVVILFAGPPNVPLRVVLALALQLAIPAATVLYRASKTRRPFRPVQAIFLYWLYYWARLNALFLVATGAERAYAK
jgi:glycosyltransferase involved in cell wall biosynthesis